MVKKIQKEFGDFARKLHSDVINNGRGPIEGTITLEASSDRVGGLNVRRTYSFLNYVCTDHCSYDREDISEFETSGLTDAFDYLRLRVEPSLVLKQSERSGNDFLKFTATRYQLENAPKPVSSLTERINGGS